MAVNPYSFKDQYKPEWQQLQRQLAGTYTGGTRFDPKPGGGTSWSPSIPNFSSTPSRGYPQGVRSGGGSAGPGVVGSAVEGMADLTEWMVETLLPLRLGRRLGSWCAARGWKIRLPLACIGATLALCIAGGYPPLVAAGVGAAAGWMAPTAIALVVMVAVYLVGLAAAVSVVAVGLAVGYSIAAWLLAWPPLVSWFGG